MQIRLDSTHSSLDNLEFEYEYHAEQQHNLGGRSSTYYIQQAQMKGPSMSEAIRNTAR